MLGKFSVKKPYTVLVAVILIVVLGVVSFTRMSADLLPNISLPYVIVMTPYPGASPETVEMVVTKPVESSMATVSNIESISSVSSENYSMVIMEFAQTTDMNSVSLEIRENLDQIKSYWDDSVGNPIIMKLNPDMLPVMIAAVGGNQMTTAEVTALTQDLIIPELESIEGVASASATGLLEESVNVIISQEKIDKINEQVFASIDEEMEDAQSELEENKQEVYDGQEELENARKELSDSEKELADSRTELDDAKKELEDGKAELEDNKTKLAEGKTGLANQKEATKEQLAAAEAKIITAKADLEALKIHLTAEIATAKMALESLENSDAKVNEIQSEITQLYVIRAKGASLTEADKAYVKSIITKYNLQSVIVGMLPPGSSNLDNNPSSGESEENQEQTEKPDSSSTETQSPDDSTTETQNPDGSTTETQKPDGSVTETQKPGGSTTETQNTDDSTTETQKPGGSTTETQNTDDSSTETKEPDDPKAETQNPAGSSTETQKLDAPVTETKLPDSPAVETKPADPATKDHSQSTENAEENYLLNTAQTKRQPSLPKRAYFGKELQADYMVADRSYLAVPVAEDANMAVIDAILQSNDADKIGNLIDSIISALSITAQGYKVAGEGVQTGQSSIEEMEEQLSEVNGNIEKLDAALQELYKGNLTAAIELANAQTTISLGELQIASAESQLESGEKQIESGYEQLDSAADQITDGYDQLDDSAEQLADALQKILDGEEDLQEAWDDAYDQADMHGILTVDTVKSLLAAQNFSMPAGYVTEEGISYLIRVGDKPEDIEALKKMPLLNPDMDGVDVITLGDVADVFMVDNSADIYANVNGSPGIMISMQKQTGYSTGDVSDKILHKFDELMEENPDLMLITLMDQGIYIDLVMDAIINNILFGGLLAVLILIFFLKDIRPTAVIACSIPISLITAIVCMYFSGITLNVISLSGLALGIGMLVDNSIVVIENIYRLRKEGVSAAEAAIKGAGEVAGAIMASTLTTVCVFLPIVFTEGITRQLFVDMGLTIAYSLGASLLIALTVVPAMASKTLVRTKEQKDGKFFTVIINGYQKVLEWALRFKPVVLILVVVLLVASGLLSVAKGTAFMPEMDSTQMTMSVSLPKDTPLSHTGEVSDEIVGRLMAMEDVKDVGAMASTSSMASLTGSGDVATNAVDIYISLKEDKKTDNETLAAQITEMMDDICKREEAEISIETSSMDMSALGGSGISIQVQGRELDTLQELAGQVAEVVESVEGTQDVSNGLEESTGELRVIIDRDKAIEHGMTVAEIFQQISAKLADATSSTTLETEIKEYDVFVKHEGDMALTRALVEELVIDKKNQDGTKEHIPLKDIASFENTISPKSVNRSDQNRYIEVSAQIADGYNVGLVSNALEEKLKSFELPEGYRLVMSGENEMINDAMEQVMLMMLLAIIFMYLIMVAQFQSLLSPFIIMFTIPLAFTGGFFGLVMSDSELSVIALIGFVMLAGIIVNNGIVLVDYTNQLREDGMEKREALLTAGRTRLRPVLMTALTTILALCTMVFSHDMGSEMAKPMAIVTIGGLVYGTMLTLIVIPCIYDLFNRNKKKDVLLGEEN